MPNSYTSLLKNKSEDNETEEVLKSKDTDKNSVKEKTEEEPRATLTDKITCNAVVTETAEPNSIIGNKKLLVDKSSNKKPVASLKLLKAKQCVYVAPYKHIPSVPCAAAAPSAPPAPIITNVTASTGTPEDLQTSRRAEKRAPLMMAKAYKVETHFARTVRNTSIRTAIRNQAADELPIKRTRPNNSLLTAPPENT